MARCHVSRTPGLILGDTNVKYIYCYQAVPNPEAYTLVARDSRIAGQLSISLHACPSVHFSNSGARDVPTILMKRSRRCVVFRILLLLFASSCAQLRVQHTRRTRQDVVRQCQRDFKYEAPLRRLVSDSVPGMHRITLERRYDALFTRRYFFAIDLHNSENVAPYLLNAVASVCVLLGQRNVSAGTHPCFVSVYESASHDATRAILSEFSNEFLRLKVPFVFTTHGIERDGRTHRIKFLSKVRNNALKVFYENPAAWDDLVFLNDVVICAGGILELLMEKVRQRAHIASGMDYILERNRVIYYDTWVNKDMSGRSFRNKVPYVQDKLAWQLYMRREPFQVFTTWAGGVVISASLFDLNPDIRFRHPVLYECASCECELLIRDFWSRSRKTGLKVMVVPAVYVAYEPSEFVKVASYLRRLFRPSKQRAVLKFNPTPPETVECCGMEFAGEEVMHCASQTTNTPWLWRYDFVENKTSTIGETVSSAVAAMKRECLSKGRRNKFHFVVAENSFEEIPFIALANMLEWARLNPCLEIISHGVDSLKTLADSVSVDWGHMATAFIDVPDAALTLSDFDHRRRMVSYLALYIHGGVAADLEVAPMAPIPMSLLESINDFEGSFEHALPHHRTIHFAQGPYVMVAQTRSPTLQRVIELGLQRALNPSKLIYKVNARGLSFSPMSPALILSDVMSSLVGKSLFTDALAGTSISSLDDIVRLVAHKRMISNIERTSLIMLSEGDILMDGEMMISSPRSILDEILWSSGLSESDNGHHGEVGKAFITLRSARRRQKKEGCLEIFTVETRERLWSHCWPASMESRVTYIKFSSGCIRVMTQNGILCESSERRVIWSSTCKHDTIRVKHRQFICMLTNTGQLLSVRRPRVLSKGDKQVNCLFEDVNSQRCNSRALDMTRRLQLRYRDKCKRF